MRFNRGSLSELLCHHKKLRDSTSATETPAIAVFFTITWHIWKTVL
jgi:hypothetical protein